MSANWVLPWALVAQAGNLEVNRRVQLATALGELVEFHRKWALLTTCHRVELYGFGPEPAQPGMQRLTGEEAVRHLFRVAAGLESAVVGETEILGQVRDALAKAREQGTDQRVARLFEGAIAAGRAARARPAPSRDGLAERAIDWLAARTPLSDRPVLVVGTGSMGSALVSAARAAGGVVTVAGRNRERAAALSSGHLDLVEGADRAPDMAAIAVAMRGEWSEVTRIASRLPPLTDLSVPPAVPAIVQRSLGPDFLGIDELWRREAVESEWSEAAQRVVAGGVAEYMGWLNSRGSVGTLVALRARGEARRRNRVERLLRRLPDLDDRARELVETMSRQLVTDLLHEPISALRSDPDGSSDEAARRLFEL